MTKRRLAGYLLIPLGIAGLLYGYAQSESSPETLAGPAAITPGAQATNPAPTSQGLNENLPWDLVNQLAEQYRARYGKTIDKLATQAELLGERRALLASHPEQGLALFEAAVAQAFPELKDAILGLIAQLVLYHQWLDDNHRALQAMPLLERQATIWQQRQQMFGDSANLIWAEEELAQNRRQKVVHEELQRLDQAFEIPPEEAVYQLQTTIEQIYGDSLERQLVGPTVLANALFGLESVQTQLQALPPDQRQARLNSLRKQMGYSDEAVAKLEALDQERNERWEKGFKYMEAREQLARQYEGEQLEQELDRLREQHFGRAAKTIAMEERDGFYRFKRGRRYGLN